jgi:hypothetical protein
MENSTLGSIYGSRSNFSSNVNDPNGYFNCYLYLFTTLLHHRYPNIQDWQSLDQSTIQNLGQFCATITPFVMDHWQNVVNQIQQYSKQQSVRTRAA